MLASFVARAAADIASTPAADGGKAARQLYRSVLRVHRYLTAPEMRSLGDAYVRDEFRRHRKGASAAQLERFFGEWRAYVSGLYSTPSILTPTAPRSTFPPINSGETSDSVLNRLDQLSDEQVAQLKELKEATSQIYNPDHEEDVPAHAHPAFLNRGKK